MVTFSAGKVHSQGTSKVEGTNDSVFNGDDIFYLRMDERLIDDHMHMHFKQFSTFKQFRWLLSTKSGKF